MTSHTIGTAWKDLAQAVATVSVVAPLAPPPTPTPQTQTVFQLIPGQKVRIPRSVNNMGLQLTNIADVGAPRFSTTVIIGGIGRGVTFGGLSYAPTDVAKTNYVGTGIPYQVVLAYDVDGNTVGVAQMAGNDGACYVQADIDGNYLSLTFFDSLGNVLDKVTGIRPGNQYDNLGKLMAWGGSISVNIIDMDQWAAWAPSWSATYFEQVTPTSYGSYKVIAGTIQLVLPSPALQISGTNHNVQVKYFDSATGAPLSAVKSPLAFGFSSGGTTPFQYQLTNGLGTYDITGPGTIYAFVGGVAGTYSAATPNTILSNTLTI